MPQAIDVHHYPLVAVGGGITDLSDWIEADYAVGRSSQPITLFPKTSTLFRMYHPAAELKMPLCYRLIIAGWYAIFYAARGAGA